MKLLVIQLLSDIIAVNCEIHKKSVDVLWPEWAKTIFTVRAGGTYINHFALGR
jgi:hypothetical protein